MLYTLSCQVYGAPGSINIVAVENKSARTVDFVTATISLEHPDNATQFSLQHPMQPMLCLRTGFYSRLFKFNWEHIKFISRTLHKSTISILNVILYFIINILRKLSRGKKSIKSRFRFFVLLVLNLEYF